MKRIPLIPTIVVTLAVVAMIALGVWQLQRRGEREAQIARYAANLGQPATAWPRVGPVSPELLFRRSSVMCLRVTGWDARAGQGVDGRTGYRQIARCATGAEGPGATVALGVAPLPDARPAFAAGRIEGWIVPAGDRDLIDRLTGAPDPGVMLLGATPVAGLVANAPPSPDGVPNNHLAYAIQWFGFALTALVVYLLALRRRLAQGRSDG